MPALVIKNLPEDIYKSLKRSAQKRHRSMTQEAITLMQDSLVREGEMQGYAEPAPLAYAGAFPLTPAMVSRWKRKGLE